jgi:hypothetical protein
MADIITESNDLLKKTAAKNKLSSADVKACLEQAQKLAIRVEAAKVVTGFFSETLISTIESFLRIAIPFVSIMGDFELSTLLGSLNIWLEKKKLQKQQEEMQRNQIQSQSMSDMNFTYSF